MDPKPVPDDAPAWGALPVERYILAKWDTNSPLSTQEQRLQLVKAFIQEEEASAVPTMEEFQSQDNREQIDKILLPWRSHQLRRIAEKWVGSSHQMCILRTSYGGGKDEDDKMQQWMEEFFASDELFLESVFGWPDDRWWLVLNDPALFDMGQEDWKKIYDIFPELATKGPGRILDEKDVAGILREINDMDDPTEDDYEDAIQRMVDWGRHIVIIDGQGFEDDTMLLVFRDAKGNVVKEIDIDRDTLQHFPHHLLRASVYESGFWTEAKTGKKYTTKGSIMRKLLSTVSGAASREKEGN